MTKPYQTILLLTALVGAFWVLGCGHDYNLDDYKRQQLQHSLGLMRQADGEYTGLAISKLDGTTLGALDAQVKTSTSSSTPNDQSDPTAVPDLQVILTYTGPQNSTAIMTFQGGSFQSDLGGAFVADYTLQRTIGTVQTTDVIEMSGTISNGHFQGSVYSKSFPNYGASFDLALHGSDIPTLLRGRRLSTERLATQQSYAGVTRFSEGVDEPVVLVLTKPASSAPSLDEFFDLLIPVQPVTATLNYGNGARLAFNGAGFDLRSGKISVTVPVAQIFSTHTEPNSITLKCNEKDGTKAIACQLKTNANPGIAARMDDLENSPNAQEPPDSSDPRAMVRRTYRGVGKFTRSGMFMGNYVMYLTAIYEARSRSEEIYNLLFPQSEKLVQVSWFEEADPDIDFSFTDAKWDGLSATLDKNQPYQESNGPSGMISISCSNFYFYKRARPFQCHFTNTIGDVDATMKFTGRPIKE